MRKAGWSLLELLVAISLASFLCVMTTQWIIKVLKDDIDKTMAIQRYFDMYSVCDILNRDLAQAPSVISQWKLLSSEKIVWQSAAKDIGWECDKGILLRIVGTYDITTNQWITRKKAVAFKELQSITFTAHTQSQRIASIAYALIAKKNDKDIEVAQHVVLVNGIVL